MEGYSVNERWVEGTTVHSIKLYIFMYHSQFDLVCLICMCAVFGYFQRSMEESNVFSFNVFMFVETNDLEVTCVIIFNS